MKVVRPHDFLSLPEFRALFPYPPRLSHRQEYENFGILDQRSSDRNPLFLYRRKAQVRVHQQQCHSLPAAPEMKSCAFASLAARIISSIVTSLRPYAILLRIVDENKNVSWKTVEI